MVGFQACNCCESWGSYGIGTRSSGKRLKAAYEDIRPAAQSGSELALLVQSAIDTCSNSLQNAIDDYDMRSPDGNKANYYSKVTVPDD